MTTSGVVVLGSLNMDLILETPVPAGPGETREGTRFYATPGGKGANQAVAAARILGDRAPVTMVGRVGKDAYGVALVASLQSAGVDTRYVRRDGARHTGVAVVIVDSRGENYVNAVYGANGGCNRVQSADSRQALKAASVFLVQQETPLSVSARVMTFAQRMGVQVILNPAPSREPVPDGFFAACDFLTPNAHEAGDLCGFPVHSIASAHRAAVQIRGIGPAAVIITLGSLGAWIESEGLSEHVPAPDVPVVSSVGAGDAFNGALAAGLALGYELREAVRLATAAGALCVTRAGAQSAMPTLAQVRGLLSKA